MYGMLAYACGSIHGDLQLKYRVLLVPVSFFPRHRITRIARVDENEIISVFHPLLYVLDADSLGFHKSIFLHSCEFVLKMAIGGGRRRFGCDSWMRYPSAAAAFVFAPSSYRQALLRRYGSPAWETTVLPLP